MDIDYNSIKRKIENEKCTEHNQNAEFIKTKKGFKIKTICCENFEKKMIKKGESLLTEETENAIDKMIKNMFK